MASRIVNKPYKITPLGFADNTGSVRLPREVMDALAVDPGDYIIYEVTSDGVRIHKAQLSVSS